jgi:hypothetical protein
MSFVCLWHATQLCKLKLILNMTQTDWIGTVGVTLLLIAFFLNLVDKIHNDSFLYLSLNLVGATIACLASILLHY